MKDPKEKTSELTEQERAELKVEWLGVDEIGRAHV